MTGREMTKWIDREGTMAVGDLTIGVKVIDTKRSYGTFRVLVTPLNGSGEQWVDSQRVKLAVPVG